MKRNPLKLNPTEQSSSAVRVCFLGTPDFALPPLEGILGDGRFTVVGVVTQPDRPAGRKQLLSPSPVKKFCVGRNFPILSPPSVNVQSILDEIQSWKADVAVVVAFGQILKTPFLELFPHGAVNIHYSLLPRWRGAAPVQRSLEAGDVQTGVALQKIALKLDAGDIIGSRTLELSNEMTAIDVFREMAPRAVDLLKTEFIEYLSGQLHPTPQNHELATVAKKIEKSESIVQWEKTAHDLHNQIRAFVLSPGSFFRFRDKRIKILKSELSDAPLSSGTTEIRPGEVTCVQPLEIQTGEGTLRLIEVQPESRNRMEAKSFCAGFAIKLGDVFE